MNGQCPMGYQSHVICSCEHPVTGEADAYLLLERLRWGDRPTCPTCGSERVNYIRPANGISRKTRTGAWSEGAEAVSADRCPDCGGPLEAFGGEHSDRQNCPLCAHTYSDDEVTQ